MSKYHKQITYKCQCDEGYGTTCESQSRFILIYNCSIDTTTIYHKRHIDDPEHQYHLYEPSQYIQDPEIKALQDLLNAEPYNQEIDPEFSLQMQKA